MNKMFKNAINILKSNQLPLFLAKRNAGHNKWANIRHIKGLKDAQRSALFTRLGRQIKVAIAEGGSVDPGSNLKLDQALEQAKRANMPVATIQSIIKSTQLNKSQCKLHQLEIKGPGGCIIMVEVFSDAVHHLRQVIATMMKKHNSKYSDGGGRHLFEEKGVITMDSPNEHANLDRGQLEELMTEHAIEIGAEEVHVDEETREITFHCSSTSLKSVADELEKRFVITSASVEHFPVKCQQLNDAELESCQVFYEKLEKLPEVVKIYDNIA